VSRRREELFEDPDSNCGPLCDGGIPCCLSAVDEYSVFNRSLYQTASLKEHQRFLQIHGERGAILDRQDHFLVSNQEVSSLVADPILFRSRLSPKRFRTSVSDPESLPVET